MTLKRNGFTVSGRFDARRTAGTCPQCSEGLVQDQPSAFLKARMGADGKADGVLSVSQRRDYARLYRQAQSLGRLRGILPRRNRRGRIARSQRPASLQEVGLTPEWLFDHMVHFECRPAFAGGAPVRDIVAHVGTRSVGVAHGVALGSSELTEADRADARAAGVLAREINARAEARTLVTVGGGSVELEAVNMAASVNAEVTTATERAAQSQPLPRWAREMAADPIHQEVAQAAREARQAASIARGREQMAALDAAAVAEEAKVLAQLEDAGAERLRLVVEAAWDDSPAAPLADDGPDASVERFKLLDLD
jgi:hypothetical protein